MLRVLGAVQDFGIAEAAGSEYFAETHSVKVDLVSSNAALDKELIEQAIAESSNPVFKQVEVELNFIAENTFTFAARDGMSLKLCL